VQGTVQPSKGQDTTRINSDNHRGPNGKAYTVWTEANGGLDTWSSDSLLCVKFQEVPEVYLHFWIKFQPGWKWSNTASSMIKMFRIGKQNLAGSTGWPWVYAGGSPTNSMPLILFDFAKWAGGAADIAISSGPRSNPDYNQNEDANDYFPPSGTYGGGGTDFSDAAWNPSGRTVFESPGMVGDGGWHLWDARVKTNSAVGAADGVFTSWIDGVQIANRTNEVWNTSGASRAAGFDFVCIGGNIFNPWAQASSGAEQWYAIDDVVVSTTPIPNNYVIGGGGRDTTPPRAPAGLRIR
jgi:hypothetical protein